MKKLLFLLLIITLSSCITRIDRAFDLYVQCKISKSENSVYLEQDKQRFEQACLYLSEEELTELENKIAKYEAEIKAINNANNERKQKVNSIIDNL